MTGKRGMRGIQNLSSISWFLFFLQFLQFNHIRIRLYCIYMNILSFFCYCFHFRFSFLIEIRFFSFINFIMDPWIEWFDLNVFQFKHKQKKYFRNKVYLIFFSLSPFLKTYCATEVIFGPCETPWLENGDIQILLLYTFF